MSAARKCTLSTEGAISNVPVRQKASVCYTFKTSTKIDLALPYAVAINGTVIAEHSKRPATLSASRTISLKVDTGVKVALFLNSDAYPRFRIHPVYEVEVSHADVLVEIEEKLGCRPDIAPKAIRNSCEVNEKDGKNTEKYNGFLTGDIWMKVSHRYTKEEAEEFLPQALLHTLRHSVLRIYAEQGLTHRTMELETASDSSSAGHRLLVNFGDEIDENVRQNIAYCPLLSDVLPRTHPLAFAVLFSEAYASGVTELRVSSSWRPFLGAIVHRVGLGIDVNYICKGSNKLKVNLTGLKRKSKTSAGSKITDTEKEKYSEYEDKLSEKANIKKALNDTLAQLKKVTGSPKTAPLNDEAARLSKRLQEIDLEAKRLRQSWEIEHRANEPTVVHDFREKLLANPDITQVLDPWYIEVNTRDDAPPTANAQIEGIESGHNNHLHITLSDHHLL